MKIINYPINEYARYKIIVTFTALTVSGLFLFYTYGRVLMGDEAQYETLGWNLTVGHGYSLSLSAPYEPTAIREPVYPLFIALIYKIFGRQHLFIYIGQISIFCFSCILIFKIGKEVFGLQVAKCSALLTSLCPTLASYSVIFYSEILFIFLLSLTVYFAILAKKTENIKWFIAAGLTMGLMALTKVIMIFFPIFIVAFFLLGRNKKLNLARYTARIVIVIFFFAITLVPWILRNYCLFEIKNLISSRAEIVLLSRAMKTDYSTKKIIIAYVYGFSEYLGSRFFPDAVEKASDFLHADDQVVYKIENDLLGQGYSQREASSILRKEAITKIKRHPFKYILQIPFEFFKMMSFMHIPLLNETNIIAKFVDLNYGLIILSSLKGAYKVVGYFIILFASIGIYIKRREWIRHFILLALILYVNLLYSLLYGYARYSIPLIPFYFMFSSVALLEIYKFWRQGFHQGLESKKMIVGIE
jgi:4-amino-4-deoxy-L-arabinose transferase-like glycosyltransferase